MKTPTGLPSASYCAMAQHRTYVPPHMREGIVKYIEYGIPMGSYGMALVCNDLRRAIQCADSVNAVHMGTTVQWFIEYAPVMSWGSPANVKKWQKTCQSRKDIAVDVDGGL